MIRDIVIRAAERAQQDGAVGPDADLDVLIDMMAGGAGPGGVANGTVPPSPTTRVPLVKN
ncbi:hypothetical protein ACFOY2_53160 [Nonomuraea purpurea]|uniref:Uncharacterized protein n=1 Tax=Nonomuraea purpurea TaxID=1849276 RepID=A0ABV8GSN6_9ACTN